MSDKKKPKDAKTKAAEAALSVSLAEARSLHAQAQVEYEEATRDLLFTKDFNTALEAVMRDNLATAGERVMAYVKRYSWGEYSLYAIGADGKPLFQVDCVRRLGLNPKTVSRVVAYNQKRGYLADEPKLLYPSIAPVLGGPTPNGKKSREYETFLADWKVSHSPDFKRMEDARSTLKEVRKVLLSDYKIWRKSHDEGEKGDGILIENCKIDSRTPSAGVPSPLEASNRRHQKAPANPPVEEVAWTRPEAAEFLCARILHFQQAYPKTRFAKPLIDFADPGDAGLIVKILDTLGSHDQDHVTGFVMHILSHFKGIGFGGKHTTPRSPEDATGPQGLGLLLTWAKDYVRLNGKGRPKTQGAGGNE